MTANVNDIKSTDLQAWPEGKTISVTLKRLVDGNKDDSFALTYTIDNGDGPFKPTSSGLSEEEKTKYQLSKTSGNITAFTSDAVFESQDADGKPYTYYIEETEITGGDYLKYYGTVSGDTVARISGAEFAQDGGVIINQESGGYELPATGGSGTNLFYILGALMIAGAGLMLLARRRRQS